MDGKTKAKKIFGVVGSVLVYAFMALCLAAVIFTIFAKKSDDGAVDLFGYELRTVLSGSMEKSDMTDVSGFKIKSIPVKSLIVTQSVPEDEAEAAKWYADLRVGDVLTFRYLLSVKQETITHRIISIEEANEGYRIVLRGDNRTENEGEQVIYTADEASPNFVVGKVVFVSVALGNVVYILQQPIGIALVVIVPAAIIIIMQVVRIVSAIGKEKRKSVEAAAAEKNNELELLKQRLADLEKMQSGQGGASDDKSPPPPAENVEIKSEKTPPLLQDAEGESEKCSLPEENTGGASEKSSPSENDEADISEKCPPALGR